MMKKDEFDPQLIKQALSGNKHHLNNPDFKESAVLILIYPDENGSYSLVLTKRTSKMKKHAGEISFPGGRFDPETDKDRVATALRESNEEIGVNINSIEILGILSDIPTISNYIITPVVGIIKDKGKIDFKRSEDEVEEILVIPIQFFLDPSNFKERFLDIEEAKIPIYTFDYYKEGQIKSIWGATAHLLVDYLSIIYDYNPSTTPRDQYPRKEIEKMLKRKTERRKERILNKIYEKEE
ncbi:MAG: CoA pyrophosphatase [archaeon]|nr:CoA pyrophosphatase [archaeon]